MSGTTASIPTTAAPSKPPATRSADSVSRASMCRTSAGTKIDENSDPASKP